MGTWNAPWGDQRHNAPFLCSRINDFNVNAAVKNDHQQINEKSNFWDLCPLISFARNWIGFNLDAGKLMSGLGISFALAMAISETKHSLWWVQKVWSSLINHFENYFDKTVILFCGHTFSYLSTSDLRISEKTCGQLLNQDQKYDYERFYYCDGWSMILRLTPLIDKSIFLNLCPLIFLKIEFDLNADNMRVGWEFPAK